MSDELLELADSIAAAVEAERALDWRVAEALGIGDWRPSTLWPPFVAGSKVDKSIPTYTTSLDASITLVPAEHQFGAGSQDATGKAWAWCGKDHETAAIANAATPALALTVACVRARASRLRMEVE